jgi:very-short-patch-repair endonuclease
VYRKRFKEAATRAAMARANGRHRLGTLEAAIKLNASGSAGTRSPGEDAFIALVQSAGLPEPFVNVKVRAGGFEVDFRWPGLCVEVDGGGHTRPRTRREDRARDAALRADGYEILRFTGDDVEQRSSDVLASVISWLAAPCRTPAAP